VKYKSSCVKVAGEWQIRQQAYHAVLAGAFGHTRVPDPSLLADVPRPAGNTTSDRIGAARTARNRQAIFNSASGRPVRVRLEQLIAGKMLAWWFNPRGGMWHRNGKDVAHQTNFAHGIASGPGTGAREFTPPPNGEGQAWVPILSTGRGI